MNKPDFDDPKQVEKSLCTLEQALTDALESVKKRLKHKNDELCLELLYICLLRREADFQDLAERAGMSPQLLNSKKNSLVKEICLDLSRRLGVPVSAGLLKQYFKESRNLHKQNPDSPDGIKMRSHHQASLFL